MEEQDMAANSFPDRGQAVMAVTTTTLVIASLFVAARLVSRIAIVRNVTWDDYFIILAWVSGAGRRTTSFQRLKLTVVAM